MSDKNNPEIREALRANGMKQWELAERLGISENTICRRLRRELPDEEKRKFLEAITK